MNTIRNFAAILFPLLALVASSLVLAQAPDYTGTWAGAMNRPAGLAGLELTLARAGDGWKATMKMKVPNGDLTPTVEEVKIAGSDISFSATQANGVLIKFKGKFDGDKLNGTFESTRGETKVGEGTIALTRGGQIPAVQQGQGGGQIADPDFDAKVAHPAYARNGPRVLFDEAHNNFHTTGGRYKPFADLITNDGYQITPNKQKFSATLKGFDILVISNALGAERMNMPEAVNAAFTAEECDAVRDWVKGGGNLLLIADHAPMGSANQILADRFGVNMSKMFTADNENYDKGSNNQSFIVYTRESGRLASPDHARPQRFGARE